MGGALTVVVDLERGEVRFGTRRVPIEPTAQPSRFRLANGAIVRAISFGERARLVRETLAGDDPAALVELLADLALDGPPDEVSIAVLLALAGAGGPARAYDECAVDACRLRGWSWRTLNDTPAIEVDRCVASSGPEVPTEPSAGWTRFVFDVEAGGEAGNELARATREMIDRLLERAGAGGESGGTGRAPRGWPGAPGEQRTPGVACWAWPPLEGPRGTGEPAMQPGRGTERQHAAADLAAAPVYGASAPRVDPKRREPDSTPVPTPAPARARFRLLPEAAPAGQPTRREAGAARVARAPWPEGFENLPLQEEGYDAGRGTAGEGGGTRGSSAPLDWPAPATGSTVQRDGQTESAPVLPEAPRIEPHGAAQATDWLDEVARALARECDLRGID